MTQSIKVTVKPHFRGEYRLEYDGKYISLFGLDTRYEGFRFSDNQPIWYEERLLIPIVAEVRNAKPEITEITETYILVTFKTKESSKTSK